MGNIPGVFPTCLRCELSTSCWLVGMKKTANCEIIRYGISSKEGLALINCCFRSSGEPEVFFFYICMLFMQNECFGHITVKLVVITM